MSAHFTPGFFKFLRDLKAHNDRAWFQANRDRYVADVEAPMLQFIADVGERLPEISSAYVANRRRMGGSMYRITTNDASMSASLAGAVVPVPEPSGVLVVSLLLFVLLLGRPLHHHAFTLRQ